MEAYYKSNYIKVPDNFYKSDIDIQIIEWWAQDEYDYDDDDTDSNISNVKNKDVYTIRCFGVTKTGVSVTCKITGFTPFYYIKVPNNFNRVQLQQFLNYIESSYALRDFSNPLARENGKHKSRVVEKKDLFGFKNGTQYKFVQLVFNNYSALMKSRYLFKKATTIPNVINKPMSLSRETSNEP
jgi:hypothetical protein